MSNERDDSSTITEVLARHAKSYNTDRSGVGFVVCRCGLEIRLDGASCADDKRTFAAHQAAVLAPLFAAAQTEALREAAATFDTRSETLLRTMQNMADSREYEPADIVRYGAYSAESNTTASWLRTRADNLTT